MSINIGGRDIYGGREGGREAYIVWVLFEFTFHGLQLLPRVDLHNQLHVVSEHLQMKPMQKSDRKSDLP